VVVWRLRALVRQKCRSNRFGKAEVLESNYDRFSNFLMPFLAIELSGSSSNVFL
jgi:hypothetical protein